MRTEVASRACSPITCGEKPLLALRAGDRRPVRSASKGEKKTCEPRSRQEPARRPPVEKSPCWRCGLATGGQPAARARAKKRHANRGRVMSALAYHLTWTTYGTW